MRTLLVALLLLVGCNAENKNKRLQANIAYLRDSTVYFENLSTAQRDEISALVQDHLRELERDMHDPDAHYKAKCVHSFGVCYIEMEIETNTKTFEYLHRYRK